MTKSYYDIYGTMARHGVKSTLQNGRYMIQKDAEQFVPADVIEKLQITTDDSFLDIGCGTGVNLIPVSKITKAVAACDHPDVLKNLNIPNLATYPGNFFDIQFDRKFSKILVYSVLHCLPDQETISRFVDKILTIMTPNGCTLLGDIPNTDMRKRFLSSERGKILQKEWEELQNSPANSENVRDFEDKSVKSAQIDDAFIAKLIADIRKSGFNAHTVKQPQNLPFGNTREDILIFGPEYADKA